MTTNPMVPTSSFNGDKNDYFMAADKAGTNDRSDVTSGSGYSRFDGDDDE